MARLLKCAGGVLVSVSRLETAGALATVTYQTAAECDSVYTEADMGTE